ncbi:endonuclease/exonuclease/phosphatase family protein [Sulfuricystis multivorans]|uniref:endonuclease/exonuclease/phosphatase family protein n=1 Tax=Sulfuricystis multivorans TaxID=2211108 RepID=UPI000F847770|nr:endonuclease/exonuclease/phosphatase family protein [Sulfuricystis multivorans]
MRILSWNIQWGRGLDGRVDLARIAEEARNFDADVYCFQEVAVNHPGLAGMPPGQSDQLAVLSGLFLGFEAIYGVGSDLPDGLGGRRHFGNLILSRLPILQVFRHLLPWPAEPSVPSMQRAAVEAVIAAPEFPGGAVRVITTHLEYYSASQRAVQCAALRAIIDEGWRHAVSPRFAEETDPPFAVLPRGEGCVLCGDFNSPAGAPEQATLTAPGDAPALVNAWHVAQDAVPPAPTFGVHERRYVDAPACYDIFFVSANIADRISRVAVDEGSKASDHQPVLLELS